MRMLSVAKSSIGLAFYLGIIFAVVYGAWRYIVPYRTPPAKPIYANDYKKSPKKKILAFAPPTRPKAQSKPQPKVQSVQAAQSAPSKRNLKLAAKSPLDPKYKGTVNSGIGLVLRSEPRQDSNKIGGADYNSSVSVLKESPDREWVYVRQEDTKEEGWIRTGNLNRN